MSNTLIDPPGAVDADAIHVDAFNAAFRELGLRWQWGVDTYRSLLGIPEERERIRAYLETRQPHLLRAYEADFLIDLIQATKARCYSAMMAQGDTAARARLTPSTELHVAEHGF